MNLHFRHEDHLYRLIDIEEVDLSRLESNLLVRFRIGGEWREVSGPDAIDLVMMLKPSALEGRRLRWVRNSWAKHNLVGHPVMQILCWLGMPKIGLRLHEATIPRPLGKR